MNNNNNKTEIATLANGCFWCTEAIFERLRVMTNYYHLIGQLPLQNDSDFALIHAKSSHPFVALPYVERHSREELLWPPRYVLCW